MHSDCSEADYAPPRGTIEGIIYDTLVGFFIFVILAIAATAVIGIGAALIFGLRFAFNLSTRDATIVSSATLFFLFACWLIGSTVEETR